MRVYWTMFLIAIGLGVFGKLFEKRTRFRGVVEKRVPYGYALLFFLPIIFYSGFRSDVNDTKIYVQTFDALQTGFQGIVDVFNSSGKGKGFTFIEVIFKTLISDKYYHWFFFVAIICAICIFRVYYKYSYNYSFSVYLFIGSCAFTWFFSGMRQFLAVCILFAFTDLLLKENNYKGYKKVFNLDFFKYFLIVLFASTIHVSSLIMLPIYFVAKGKPWNRPMLITIFVMILALLFLELFTGVLDNALEDTNYSDVVSSFDGESGTNVIRVIVHAVPTIIALIFRKRIENKATPFVNFCINVSVFTVGFYLISVFTSGVTIGRIPVFFELYNYILLPWLIKYAFNERERTFVVGACLILYFAFFLYQMQIVGMGQIYVSQYLKIHYYW